MIYRQANLARHLRSAIPFPRSPECRGCRKRSPARASAAPIPQSRSRGAGQPTLSSAWKSFFFYPRAISYTISLEGLYQRSPSSILPLPLSTNCLLVLARIGFPLDGIFLSSSPIYPRLRQHRKKPGKFFRKWIRKTEAAS